MSEPISEIRERLEIPVKFLIERHFDKESGVFVVKIPALGLISQTVNENHVAALAANTVQQFLNAEEERRPKRDAVARKEWDRLNADNADSLSSVAEQPQPVGICLCRHGLSHHKPYGPCGICWCPKFKPASAPEQPQTLPSVEEPAEMDGTAGIVGVSGNRISSFAAQPPLNELGRAVQTIMSLWDESKNLPSLLAARHEIETALGVLRLTFTIDELTASAPVQPQPLPSQSQDVKCNHGLQFFRLNGEKIWCAKCGDNVGELSSVIAAPVQEEKCPTCWSNDRAVFLPGPHISFKVCNDLWHSSGISEVNQPAQPIVHPIDCECDEVQGLLPACPAAPSNDDYKHAIYDVSKSSGEPLSPQSEEKSSCGVQDHAEIFPVEGAPPSSSSSPGTCFEQKVAEPTLAQWLYKRADVFFDGETPIFRWGKNSKQMADYLLRVMPLWAAEQTASLRSRLEDEFNDRLNAASVDYVRVKKALEAAESALREARQQLKNWAEMFEQNRESVEIDPEAMAKVFHVKYEFLAPRFNYKTRPDSATDWENVPAPNRKLMIETCKLVILWLYDQLDQRVRGRESAIDYTAEAKAIIRSTVRCSTEAHATRVIAAALRSHDQKRGWAAAADVDYEAEIATFNFIVSAIDTDHGYDIDKAKAAVWLRQFGERVRGRESVEKGLVEKLIDDATGPLGTWTISPRALKQRLSYRQATQPQTESTKS